jgi:hypothetical protein
MFVLIVAGCRAKTLDGGSDIPAADAGPALDASRSPGTGTRTFGEGCETTEDCVSGLQCLPFSVHPNGEPCKVVGTQCSKPCATEEDCSGLSAPAMCFRGCADGEAVCGKFKGASDAVSFTVADAPEPLTSSASDPLFVLTVTKLTPVRPYPAANVEITVEPAGETGTFAECTHDDKNGNGSVDVGETLSCAEPPADTYRASHVDQTIPVSFVERTDGGSYVARGSALWKPTN